MRIKNGGMEKGAKVHQIQYSTSKKFTAKTTKTIKKFGAVKKLKKGKTYFVRVRAVKNGVTSKWSSRAKIKIKR